MWPYWRDKYCEPVDALEGYYEELLKEDTTEAQDLRTAVSCIRNARRTQSTVATEIIKINNAAIDAIMSELADKTPIED
jgi:hypothetical protein